MKKSSYSSGHLVLLGLATFAAIIVYMRNASNVVK
jgi:hypothetical protein